MAWRDERTFVGRERELQLFEGLLGDREQSSVVFVHGPGGVGKSTLLREVARRAVRRGYTPVLVEGRDLAPVPGQLEQALHGVTAHERPLVVFDTYERMSAAGGYLRSHFLPALPEGALVIVAGRRAPEPGWLSDGWEHVTTAMQLRPLGDEDATALVGHHGLQSEETVRSLVRWANGSPLALSLGAEAAAASGTLNHLGELDDDPDLARALLQRLARAELDGGDLDVLAVAAIARVTYASMLRDVLPGTDPEEAEAWLRGLSFSEPVGAGVTLHDVVRRALRAELRRRDHDRERELRRRVADHLYARAVAGETRFMVDLADLVDDPVIRWGFGANTSSTHRVDHVRVGDMELAGALVAQRLAGGGHGWWAGMRRFFEEAPERVVIARDDTDALCGVCVAVTPANAPAFADEDRVLGPWLAHARATIPDGNVLIWRDTVDLAASADGLAAAPVLAILNTAAMLRCGLTNQRWSYLPIDPENPVAVAFSVAVGARHEPSLDVIASTGERVECHILDHGSGGVLGGTRDAVYRELGLTPPVETTTGAPPRAPDFEDVREALRVLHQPLALAASPLAIGAGADERAASVRQAIQAAVASVFGDSVDETLLRRIIERGYLDPQGGHELAALELNVSRATYFRRLRRACDRVAEFVISARVV